MWPCLPLVLTLFTHQWLYICNASKHGDHIYTYFPNHLLSYCSRKLNTTNQLGCASQPGRSAGIARFVSDLSDLNHLLNKSSSIRRPDHILLIDFSLFIDTTLMSRLRAEAHWITGLIVFSPTVNSTVDLPHFSESTTCPNAQYSYYGPERQCDEVTPSWNPSGTDYSSIEWPFPVVLYRQDETYALLSGLESCYEKFNTNPVDDTRCFIEINNAMSAVRSSVVCSRRQRLMAAIVHSDSPMIYCHELTGVNIVLGLTNISVAAESDEMVNSTLPKPRPANSSILVVTRLDSRSMFERSGFASQGILPTIAVLISTAARLANSSAVKSHNLTRDLFFVFLDNEAYDFTGSARFNHDLHWEILATHTGAPLRWSNVHSVIELGLILQPSLGGNPAVPTYFMLTDKKQYKQTTFITNELMEQIAKAGNASGRLAFEEIPDVSVDWPLPPTVSLQALLHFAGRPLPHLLLTDHAGPPLQSPYFESFLDTQWPPRDKPSASRSLFNLADSLADALHRLITPDGKAIEKSNQINPGEIMECFVNNQNCSLLQTFLTQDEINYLMSLGTPIPGQTYLPLNKYHLKISHIVNILLMGLTGERTGTRECPPSDADKSYRYILGTYNNQPQCYRTLLDTAEDFGIYDRGTPMNPGWMQSTLLGGSNFIRWYRGSSKSVDILTLIVGILIVVLSGICGFFLRHMQDIQHPTSVVHVELVQTDNTDSNSIAT